MRTVSAPPKHSPEHDTARSNDQNLWMAALGQVT